MTSTVEDVPGSAWLLGWASLAGQLVTLAERGPANLPSALISVPLSALVVAWFSYGVLRARMVRTWIAGILLGLMSLLSLVALVVEPSLGVLAEAGTIIVAFGAFLAYIQSDCFARYRAEPDRVGPDLAGLVTLAVVVGALGGLTAANHGPADQQSGFNVWVGL
jgi:hypothetical protein